MSWNYRIVKYKDGSGYGLHEVYYDDAGLAWSMTERAIDFTADSDDGPGGIADAMELAIKDARERPVFDEPTKWPGRAPSIDEPNAKFEA
jgi:hypothetical protein